MYQTLATEDAHSSEGLGVELVEVPHWWSGDGLGENTRNKWKTGGLVGHRPMQITMSFTHCMLHKWTHTDTRYVHFYVYILALSKLNVIVRYIHKDTHTLQ